MISDVARAHKTRPAAWAARTRRREPVTPFRLTWTDATGPGCAFWRGLEAPSGFEPENGGFAGLLTGSGETRNWARIRAFWPVSLLAPLAGCDWECAKVTRSARPHSQAIHTCQVDPAGGSTALA